MNKREFFDKLHTELAKEYNIDMSIVTNLRNMILGNKLTYKELLTFSREHIKKLRTLLLTPNKKHHRLNKRLENWQAFLRFLITKPELIKPLTIKTKYDK